MAKLMVFPRGKKVKNGDTSREDLTFGSVDGFVEGVIGLGIFFSLDKQHPIMLFCNN